MIKFTKSYHWLSLYICILSIFVWPEQATCISSAKTIGLVAVVTDFDTTDFYVGAMQGAMYSVNPQARIVTITHEVEPFNVAEGSYILVQAAREFPSGTVFLAVVDPGVGTERRPIVLQTKDEKLFVAPDNGLLTGVMDAFEKYRDVSSFAVSREDDGVVLTWFMGVRRAYQPMPPQAPPPTPTLGSVTAPTPPR